jgi:O-antigen ligase
LKKILHILLLVGCLLVLGSTALPRIYVSIGMMLLVVPCFFLQSPGLVLKKYLNDGFSMSIGLLFLLPFISGIYSADANDWWKVCQIKLSLLLLPFAAYSWPVIQGKYVKAIQSFFVLALFMACCWSIAQYLAHASEITDGYLRAKVIPVPMGNSHVWFSYMVVVGVLFLIATWPKSQLHRALHVAGIIFFSLFLHLLAAKTGLVFLYGSLLLIGLRQLFMQQKKWIAAMAIVTVIGLPFLAMQVFPTFKNRVQYMLYDFGNVANGKYEVGSNDGNRVVSLMAGWDIVKKDPVLGIGYGDVKPTVETWYKTNRPQTPPEEFTPPSNNWVLMWCGIGIAAFAVLAFLFFQLIKNNPNKTDLTWWLLCGMAFLSTLYENPFESQYGVYAFLVPFLIWQKLIATESANKKI